MAMPTARAVQQFERPQVEVPAAFRTCSHLRRISDRRTCCHRSGRAPRAKCWHRRGRLRSQRCAGAASTAVQLGHKGLRDKLAPATLARLARIKLSIDAVTQMDLWVNVDACHRGKTRRSGLQPIHSKKVELKELYALTPNLPRPSPLSTVTPVSSKCASL